MKTTTVWVEVVPDFGGYSWRTTPYRITVGKVWKREPKRAQIAPGAIAVQVTIEVPTSRFDVMPSAVIEVV